MTNALDQSFKRLSQVSSSKHGKSFERKNHDNYEKTSYEQIGKKFSLTYQVGGDEVGHPERYEFAKRNNKVDEYIHGRKELLYVPSDLYTLGMGETGISLLAALVGEQHTAKKHMTFAFIRKMYAEGIDILHLKGTGRTTISDLDGLTNIMLGGLAMGQPELVKKFHRIVFDALAGAMVSKAVRIILALKRFATRRWAYRLLMTGLTYRLIWMR